MRFSFSHFIRQELKRLPLEAFQDKEGISMVKNLILLAFLTWVTTSYAKQDHSIVHDSMIDAEKYKVEKAVEEQSAKRSLAGSKIKKKKLSVPSDESSKPETSELDSEVRYWQYSE